MTEEEFQNRYGTQTTSQPSVGGDNDDGNFLTGLAKSGKGLIRGTSEFGESVGRALLPKSIEDKVRFPEQDTDFGGAFSQESLSARGSGEKFGKFVGDVAQFAIPGSKAFKATSKLSTAPKLIGRGLTGGTTGTLQSGELGSESAIGAGTEALAPGAFKIAGRLISPVTGTLSRLFRGLGGSLSGMSSEQLDLMLSNPTTARKFPLRS